MRRAKATLPLCVCLCAACSADTNRMETESERWNAGTARLAGTKRSTRDTALCCVMVLGASCTGAEAKHTCLRSLGVGCTGTGLALAGARLAIGVGAAVASTLDAALVRITGVVASSSATTDRSSATRSAGVARCPAGVATCTGGSRFKHKKTCYHRSPRTSHCAALQLLSLRHEFRGGHSASPGRYGLGRFGSAQNHSKISAIPTSLAPKMSCAPRCLPLLQQFAARLDRI